MANWQIRANFSQKKKKIAKAPPVDFRKKIESGRERKERAKSFSGALSSHALSSYSLVNHFTSLHFIHFISPNFLPNGKAKNRMFLLQEVIQEREWLRQSQFHCPSQVFFLLQQIIDDEDGFNSHNSIFHRSCIHICSVCGSHFRLVDELNSHKESFGGDCGELKAQDMPIRKEGRIDSDGGAICFISYLLVLCSLSSAYFFGFFVFWLQMKWIRATFFHFFYTSSTE